MADDRIQQLYDQAFSKWQNKEIEEAVRLVDEALSLAEDDPALNALALHIKSGPDYFDAAIIHAERILDVDIHYRDVIDGTEGGRRFVRALMLFYPVLKINAEDGELTDPLTAGTSREEAERRMCAYGTKLLKAGYGIPNLDYLLESLLSLEKYDYVIEIGACLAGLASSAEA